MRTVLDDEQRSWTLEWWKALQPAGGADVKRYPELQGMGRAERAKLRRCKSIDDLLLEPATHRLAARLLGLERVKAYPRFGESGYVAVALLAGALARAESHSADGASLPRLLGHAGADGQPKMSEIRFRRLQKARDVEDFYRQLVRAVQLARDRTDVAVLADDVMAWFFEDVGLPAPPSDGLKFRWARDYYLPVKEQATK